MPVKRSKRYQAIIKGHDKYKELPITDAIKLLKTKANAKFEESLEAIFFLNIDKSKTDQNLRTVVDLPNGNGKKIKVAVICGGDKIDEAKNSGADKFGSDDLINEINSGKINFDILVSTPDMMGKVGKLGKILGPKGLMPNPKLGTVSKDIKLTVSAIKKGRTEIKCDKDGNLGLSIGKIKFDDKKLEENFNSVYEVVSKEKPSGIKGHFISSVYLSTTMGPSVKLKMGAAV
ncbi:MAG: 50S ribosomal protein L1 [Candidatus Fonsibacter sp.]|jgi:large subunit ribosomal protein L1